MTKRNILTYFLFCAVCIFSQVNVCSQDSSRLRISLLTCTPGDELYSLFGHSALRVIDSNSVTDIVYNYGTFNFDDDGFYIKFVRGKLLYYISIEHFENFRYLYQATGRGITEQVLDLDSEEKTALRNALNENLREENRYYKYDFFLDNCTTRLRDLIVKFKSPTPVLPAVMPEGTRFREAIHGYLNRGKQYWSKLGIDILLGLPTDIVMTPSQQQFLPDNLMNALDRSENVSLVSSKKELYNYSAPGSNDAWFTPLVCFLLLAALMVFLSFTSKPWALPVLSGLDGLLFFFTGFIGCVIVFMWTSTDHAMARENFNLLWAVPSHLVFSFFITSKKRWVRFYYAFTLALYTLLVLSWFFLPQNLNENLLIIIGIMMFRCLYRYLSISK